MEQIKLKQVYSIIIPQNFTQNEIINKLQSIIGNRVCFSMGMLDSFSVAVRGDDGSYKTFLDINFKTKNGVPITIISQEIEGLSTYGKEVYKEEPVIMNKICNELEGLLLVKLYKTIHICELDKVCYLINYKEDSFEYKTINLLINTLGDEIDVVSMSQILKQNKTELLDIIK